MRRSAAVLLTVVLVAGAVSTVELSRPPAAEAGIPGLGSLGSAACKVLGTVGEGWWGKACTGVLDVGGKLAGAGKKAAGVIGKVAGNPLVQRTAALGAILAWVLGGAKWTMDHMAGVISSTTAPTVTAGWFTGVYLRVEGIALFFTLLFLCAAAAEALLRSDAALLARAVFVYLPLAAVLTSVAAPLTMLLLAASDQLSSGLASVAGGGTTHFLTGTSAWVLAGLTAADPFFAVMAGGLVVAAGGALWVEMLVREIAVYVVVAMLPLVFAAMVWPARRVWATRTVEVLVALILSKVAIVVVLALGGAALDHAGVNGISKLLGGLALVILGAFSPWLLLRLIPLAEVAAAGVGHIRGHVHATAGLRTPEAALARRAMDQVSSNRHHRTSANGDAGAMASGLGVQELLEQMHRRAQAAAQTTPPDPGDALAPLASNGRITAGDPSASRSNGASASPSHPAAGLADAQDQTMVQQPDGSWKPLEHTDPKAVIPPPPWEETHPSAEATEDPTQSVPPPPPDPHDSRLFGDEEDAT